MASRPTPPQIGTKVLPTTAFPARRFSLPPPSKTMGCGTSFHSPGREEDMRHIVVAVPVAPPQAELAVICPLSLLYFPTVHDIITRVSRYADPEAAP